LARWHHATRGWISPAEFIPVAEETGVIQQLSRWILRQACQQLLHWQRSFPEFAPLKMSVNLSAQELRKPTMVSEILQTLDEVGLEPHYLTLEITESMLIEDINQTIELLTELKRHHIQISIDDFGTGYSSLSYLHRLPADYLKIDRSFVGQMEKGNRNFQVVSTIVALSNQLGLDVVAEGVETQQQLRWLEQLGCELGQGYLFAKPLPPQEIERQFFAQGLNPELIEEERRSVINQSLMSHDQPRSGSCPGSSV
jgi:EAL domain-containing protein (putative c-di-GMP-specific phosphodiesterase class I)